MTPSYSNPHDGQTIALLATGWIVTEADRADRFLSLTGLDSGQLRSGLDDPGILGAVLDFLMAHEPDLIACADAIGLNPQDIVAARGEIG